MANVFTDKPATSENITNLTPQQQAVQNQALGRVSDLLTQTAPSKFNFAPIEQQARENFTTKTIPSLAERFVGQGSGTHSSAFRGALGGAGAELETNLAALGAEYGLRSQEAQQHHLTNLLHAGLGKSFETVRTPSEPSMAKEVAQKAGGKLVEVGIEKAVNKLFGDDEKTSTAGDIAGKATGAAVGVGAGAAAKETGKGIINWVKSFFKDAPSGVADTVTTTAQASSDPSAWSALPPAIVIAGTAYLINRKINQLEAEGKAQEAAEEKEKLVRMQQYYDDKASGKFGNPGGQQWPKRNPNEDAGAFLQRLIAFNKQQYPQGGQ